MQNIQETETRAQKNSTPQSPLIVIEREFNVPVSQLFKAFTTPDSLKVWWWPKGLYSDRVDLEFREGGNYFINMKGFDQGGGGMTGQFEKIVENERIVMSDHFADENGRPISAKEAKMPGDWPEVVWVTFEFSSSDRNSSRIRLSQDGIPAELQKDCIQGWTEMFDKLENYFNGSR